MPVSAASLDHDTLVATQFGGRARAYVDSPDHSAGADLDRLAILAAACSGGRMLDVGCGGGHVSFALAPHAGEVVACDLSPDMLFAVGVEAAARGLRTIRTERGSAMSLPFADASFDLVATRFSAHHWSDLDAGLAEMRRVVKPGGLVVIMDAVSPGSPVSHDTFLQAVELLRDPSHVRDYSVKEWLDALQAADLAAGEPVRARLRLEFARWVARIGTPADQVAAIRALQAQMTADALDRFAVEDDGSFKLDTVLIEARPASR